MKNMLQKLLRLELEEKILNGSALIALMAVFFPWMGGEWLGGEIISYSGLGFYTSFIGLVVLLLLLFTILVTLIPLTGGPQLIRKQRQDIVRMLSAGLATILVLAVWSVHTRFTFEFSRLEIHFGLYLTLVGSIVTTFYAFLRFKEKNRSDVEDFFHHNEKHERGSAPPPPTENPEDHHLYRS